MTEGIVIPGRLRDLLAKDSELSGAVTVTLARYSDWLAESRLAFFPEYTDHGPTHIANVLAASNRLITDAAFPVLSPQDAGALVIAVLLHDIALHLTQAGFCRLAPGRTALQPISELGDKAWPVLWEQFRAEAIRFSGAENMRLFGDPAAVVPPALDQWNWSKKQDLLVGEFIRRHHARLAHQIALHGFPGSEREELELSSLLPAAFSDVAGLIARSHGMPLRPCTDYLQGKYFNRLDPLRVHALFLMCVLRVADYMQIESDRAPIVWLRMSPLRSPISIQEWKKHHSIGEVTPDENDPEAYTVLVTPEKVDCVGTCLQIRALLDSIQSEIDQSWAVLGEVYGRQRDSNRPLYLLGLTMRRVRSNLNDPHFLGRLPFEPVSLRFRSADAKLFRLLTEPLYGGEANIGVRELLQNSIDAVRELEAFCKRHRKDRQEIELPDQPAEVVVELVENTEGQPCLTVRDRGIGMTLEIIRDYFLCVGASFRESLAWRSEFTSIKGTSEVLRTGYFGVGALAGFLVGEQIKVSTRHVTSEEGLEFSTTIDTYPIQIRRIKRPVGTTITIPLRRDLRERGWQPHIRYYLNRPSLAGVDAPSQFYPDVNDPIPPRWQKLREPKRPVIMWARGLPEYYAERVTHNGFIVEHGDQQPRVIWQDQFYGLRLFCPFLHILDFEGNQQRPDLNLARTEFILDRFEHLPCLFDDMLRDYLAYLMVTCPETGLSPMLKPAQEYRYVDFRLTDLNCGFSASAPQSLRGRSWVYTKEGIALLDAEILDNLGITTLLVSNDEIVLQLVRQDTGTAASIPQSNLWYLHGHIGAGDLRFLYPRKGVEIPPAGLNVMGSEAITIKRSAVCRQKRVDEKNGLMSPASAALPSMTGATA